VFYVEWLRVRNIARVLAIVLGVGILISLVLRISFNSQLSMDTSFINSLTSDPGSKVTDTVLPSGLHRKTITNPGKNEIITIDDTGDGGRHIVVTEPAKSHAQSDLENATIASVHFHRSLSTDGNTITTTVDTDGPTPFIYYMMVADLMAFVIATLLATPFARENDGHLEFALTRPLSRTANALGVIGVDLAGIVLCSAMTVLAVIVCQAMFEVPRFDFSGINTNAILMGFAFPFAWYAMVNAATASLSRGYGAIQGFAWPVAILVVVFGTVVTWGDSLVGAAVHNIFWVIARIDPLTYASFNLHIDKVTGALTTDPGFSLRFGIELLLFAVYSVLAVIQWRRVEA